MESNLVKQSSEWKGLSTPSTDERQIIEAHKTKKISAASNKEIKQALGVITIMIGLQNELTEPEEIILLDVLRNVYPNIGIQELQLAFVMGLAGKLSANMDHYGVLNFKYISEVLRAYIEVAKQAIDKIPPVAKPIELPLPPPQTDEEFIEENYTLWFTMKNKFYQFINHMVYESLLRKGLINLSEEDKIRIRAAVKFDIERSEAKRGFKELQHRLKEIKNAPDGLYFTRQCKKYAVAEYFNSLFEQGKVTVL